MLRKMDLRRGLSILGLMGLGVTGWGGNWPAWRGADGSGIAAEGDFPIQWGPEKNIKWKVETPGKGHSSPVIWGDKIFITTAIPTEPIPEVSSHFRPRGNRGGSEGERGQPHADPAGHGPLAAISPTGEKAGQAGG